MDKKDFIIFLVSSLIALSGWGTVIYNHVTSKPKIRGRVFQVMRGQMKHPGQPNKELTAFTCYFYLLNVRKNSIHILDYELEINVDNKWIRLDRVYGIHKIPNMTFLSPKGQNIEIRNFSNNLIYRKNIPVEYGKPLHGWVVFAGSPDLHQKDITKYRLTCIDAYKKKHIINTKPNDFANIYLLQDLADISIPQQAIIDP